MDSEATGKFTSERPVFAHHPDGAKSLLILIQDACQRCDVAEESLVGSQSVGYSTEQIFIMPRVVKYDDNPKNTGDTSLQGTEPESERMTHIGAARAPQVTSVDKEDVLRLASGHGLRKSRRQSSRTLVVGGMGSSKTMLLGRKWPGDWSRGKIWHHIEFLFVLPLKDESVHKAEKLEDLIQLEHLGIIDKNTVEGLRTYIHNHWDRVCFIFDGLDDVKLDKCSDYVRKIIQGQALTQAHVVVTSRPSKEVLILDRDYPFETRLELKGFGQEEMAEYVRRVLKAEHAADFLGKVTEFPQLAELLQTPLLCVSYCAIYRTDMDKLPTTVPAMVATIMDGVVLHLQGKLRNADSASTDRSKAEAEVTAAIALTNGEDLAKDHSPRISSSSQIPEKATVAGVPPLVNRRPFSSPLATTASSSSHDGPSSQIPISSPPSSAVEMQHVTHEDDPWEHRLLQESWEAIMKVHPGSLRRLSFAAGLITMSEQAELLAIVSPQEHNEKFINYIRSGGLKSFQRFLRVLNKMGLSCDLLRQNLEKI